MSQGVAGCAATTMATTSAPRSVLCKETYSTDLMNLPGSRSHGFQYICWSDTVPRPHPARMPAGCDRQVCGDLLSPHDDSPAQAPAAGPPSALQTCGLPHSWCVCQVLSDGGALASRDAGQRPTSLRSLPQRTPRASTGKGATPAVALRLSDDRAGKSLTTQGAGPAPAAARRTCPWDPREASGAQADSLGVEVSLLLGTFPDIYTQTCGEGKCPHAVQLISCVSARGCIPP